MERMRSFPRLNEVIVGVADGVVVRYDLHKGSWGDDDIGWLVIETRVHEKFILNESLLDTDIVIENQYTVIGPGASGHDFHIKTHGFLLIGDQSHDWLRQNLSTGEYYGKKVVGKRNGGKRKGKKNV
jgi:hypothetical protein